MLKFLLLILLGFTGAFVSSVRAQNKYALLVGINDYYSAPGLKDPHSLKGCVNDAVAMKTLLTDRFAFQSQNIHTLFDAQATKKTILASLKGLLNKCKPGDAMVFYYSGHGVWIENDATIDDPVKKGISQAMVTSDLYAEKWECLLRDATLKKWFNQFVDKRVKVTTIFDCCYSGTIMMMPSPFGENKYEYPSVKPTEKYIPIGSIGYIPKVETPRGCSADSSLPFQDTLDTDSDGVPDCADFEVKTLRVCFPVDSLGIGGCEQQDLAFMPEDEMEFSTVDSVAGRMTSSRAFSISDVISIPDREIVPRPSDRPNSGFLSMSATSYKEKGLEISDESGVKHGAFTKAMLAVYKENPATLTTDVLMKKIHERMVRQRYRQTPTYFYDPGRLKTNLIGSSETSLKKTIVAKCTAVKSGLIHLDKGTDAGISKGNILTSSDAAGKVRVQVVSVEPTTATATAIDIRMTNISPGTEFTLTDGYTISSPMVKVYIGKSRLTAGTFTTFFEKKIRPFVRLANYRDYRWWSNLEPTQNIFFNESGPANSEMAGMLLEQIDTIHFHVFLPIPGYINEAIERRLKKDQNVQVVDAASKADFVLYLNYAKPRNGRPGEFIFTFCRLIDKEVNQMGARPFYTYHTSVPSLNLSNDQLIKLAEQINDQAWQVVRGKTTMWLNEYQRR